MKRVLLLSGTVWLPVVLFSGMFWLLEVRSQSSDTFDQTSAHFAASPVQSNLGTNIVTNGDFEEPDVEAITFDTYNSGDIFGHWTVESGLIDHISERYWQAADGRQSVDLDGTCGAGSIYQDLLADVGQTYLLRFALAGNPEGPPSVKQMEIWWGSMLIDTVTFEMNGFSNWNMGWSYHQYLFTNFQAIPRLRFKSLTPGCYGPVIDVVSVQATDPSFPLLDLPIDYTGKKFSEVALGKIDNGPGRVTSWVDHFYPNYTENYTVTIWNGSVYTTTKNEIKNLNSDNCYEKIARDACYNGHPAIDFVSSSSETIYPAGPGTVVDICNNYPCYYPNTEILRREAAYGKWVLIKHNQKYATFYAHLSEINPNLNIGTEITDTKAITVGIMGGTGRVPPWPVHLHFGVLYDKDDDGQWEDNYHGYSEAVDPYGWFGAGSDPWNIESIYLWKYPLWDQTIGDSLGALLTSPSGLGKITIPAGVISGTLTLELWDAPQSAPILPSLRSIRNAIWMRVLEWLPSHLELAPAPPDGFDSPFTVNMRYQPEEVRHLDISQLAIHHLDDTTRSWNALSSTIDYNLRSVTAQSTEIGYFDLQAPLLCPTDTFEIDDNYSLANPITPDGNPIHRLFDIADDEDWFKFTAIEGADYTISLSALSSGVDTIIQLYDTDGITVLAEINDPDSGAGSLEWSAPGSGIYFIRVLPSTGSAVGCDSTYDLSVSQIVPTCNVCYNFNESSDGEIDIQDILFVANRWGETSSDPNYDSKYDVFCSSSSPPDGNINVLDIQTVANNWGQQSCQPSVFLPGELEGGSKQFELTSIPTATVSVYPQVNLIDVGDSVELEILIENAQNLGGFEFRVSYDPSVVQVSSADSITLGDFLGSTGRTATLLTPVIDNDLGSLKVGAFSFGSSEGPTGAGKLVNIKFDSTGAGLSDINLNDVLLATTDISPQIQPSIGIGGSITVSSPLYLPIVIR